MGAPHDEDDEDDDVHENDDIDEDDECDEGDEGDHLHDLSRRIMLERRACRSPPPQPASPSQWRFFVVDIFVFDFFRVLMYFFNFFVFCFSLFFLHLSREICIFFVLHLQ